MSNDMKTVIRLDVQCPIIAERLKDDIAKLLREYERTFSDAHLKRSAALALGAMRAWGPVRFNSTTQ